ncbi:MAG: T9SS type A sorting domain-containing protein, partial [Ignavibacteriaceae bacterium]
PQTVRFLTYDPTANGGTEGLLLGSFSTNLQLISMTGTVLTTHPYASLGVTSIYGAAWDGYSAGGPFLWLWGQGAGAGSPQWIVQINPVTGLPTGVTHDVLTDIGVGNASAIAGGLFISEGLVPGFATLGGLLQGVPDRLFGYELTPTGPPCPIDPATNPNPANGATDVPISLANLTWTNGTGATSMEVLFGETGNMSSVYTGPVISSLPVPIALQYLTSYSWRVIGMNDTCQVGGPTWNFTTVQAGPGVATNPSPSNGATNVDIDADLSWTNPAGATSIEVFFGTNPGSLASVYNGVPVATWDPGQMNFSTHYYWRVDETDGTGTTPGILWDFTTMMDPNAPVFVVPSDYTNVPGTATFLGPLYTAARTYQLLIHEDLLTSVVDKSIRALSWRIPVSSTDNWPATDITVTDYDLYLSGSVPPANRDLTNFSANVVGPQIQVRSGSLTIPTGSYTFGNSPNEFGPEITFDTDYLYQGGHLLIELRLSGTGSSRSTDAIGTSTPGYGTLFSACWGSGSTANSGSQGNFTIVRLSTGVIPVELTSFSASSIQNNVILNWTTATETNNYGFQIERSNASEFQSVGFVAGYGTTSEPKNYSFTETGLKPGTYSYRLKQVDFDGTFEYSDVVEVDVLAPKVYALNQNFPNPFNPSTKITFSLATDSKVSLKVFDVLGQEVITIVNNNLSAGAHEYSFDASSFNSGVYFYRIEASGADGQNFTSVKKMILAK